MGSEVVLTCPQNERRREEAPPLPFFRPPPHSTIARSDQVRRYNFLMTESEWGERARERDGVSSLRDVEAEEGDEDGTADTFDMDDVEARELGAQLDGRDEPEPGLD